MPAQTIELARQKLHLLEQQSTQPQGDLFHLPAPVEDTTAQTLLLELEAIDADELSPKQALDLIYHLKNLAKS
jgi:DNA mismatch repair protein MutS